MYKKRFSQLFSDSRNRAAITASSVIMLVRSLSFTKGLLVSRLCRFLTDHRLLFKYKVIWTITDNPLGSTAMWKFVHPLLPWTDDND